MNKYRILGIAPYEGFKGYLLNSINKRNDIDAEIYSASLDTAVDLIKSIDLSQYDAVISRGRTGKMVQSSINIPFVNVEFSGYDLMRALKLAQFSQNKKTAFLTFFDLAQSAKFLTELLEFKTNIIIPDPPSNNQEMEEIIMDLYYSQHVQLFVGDGACVEFAATLGAETVLITSGSEAMDKAVDEAVSIISYTREEREKNEFYHSILEQSNSLVAVFDKNADIVYSKLFADSEAAEAHKFLKKYISKTLADGSVNCIENTTNTMWRVSGKAILSEKNEKLALFEIRKAFSVSDKKIMPFESIDIKTCRDCAALISASAALSEIWEKIKLWAAGRTPILIYGSSGTGKKTLAYAIHSVSKFGQNPFISIDCGNIDAKAMNKLFEDERSPLFENHYTILFKKINLLPMDLQNKLSYYISNTALTSRNRVIATFTGNAPGLISDNQFSEDLYHQIAGVHIYMPALQERKEDIPTIARNFLTIINQQMPVQIAGFEPEAMQLLSNYHWEYGITQLHFLLKQLVVMTKHQFITIEDVSSVISQNGETIRKESQAETPIDITKTLDEINLDIINMVLAEENGNQSKTAKRLGISRSTLWKKLSL